MNIELASKDSLHLFNRPFYLLPLPLHLAHHPLHHPKILQRRLIPPHRPQLLPPQIIGAVISRVVADEAREAGDAVGVAFLAGKGEG